MRSKPLYVIIPVYNSSKYLEKCLNSVLDSKYDNKVVVCIDDGSTDNSLSILSKYSKNNNLVVIKQKNMGPSSARNVGLDFIKNAEKGYLTFVDSDDYVSNTYFLSLIETLEENDVDIVCSSFFYAAEESVNQNHNIKSSSILSSFESLIKLFEDREIYSMPHHKLFKSELWNDVRFPDDLFFLEDTATIYKAFIKANKIMLSTFCGYYYRQDNAASIMRKKIDNKRILSGWKALKSVYEYKFDEYENVEKDVIIRTVINLFIDNYLELLPYFDLKSDREDLDLFIKYIKDHKMIKLFTPSNKKQKTKKAVYLFAPRLYRPLFKCYNILLRRKR